MEIGPAVTENDGIISSAATTYNDLENRSKKKGFF